MNADPVLLQMKYARVIRLFAVRTGVTLDAAPGIFYHSGLCRPVSEGVSDMHCMRDAYLAEKLETEYLESGRLPPA